MKNFRDSEINSILEVAVLIKVPPTETPHNVPPEIFYKIFSLFQIIGDYVQKCRSMLLSYWNNI